MFSQNYTYNNLNLSNPDQDKAVNKNERIYEWVNDSLHQMW